MKNREIPQEEQNKYERDLMAFASQGAILKALEKEPALDLKIMTPEEHAKARNSAYDYLIP